ncbi:hypothetical protein BP6252_14004 [Coleophoma cylindrospora]|uniref:Uncharacterized protein n=1 Tax=Coleophoma cylindrospora TaxID=1849047 RepID=A0A3D8Q4H8_9HELO|nr:hypothetical protein BP6252_14004 [Coleophoma cylindrospora]
MPKHILLVAMGVLNVAHGAMTVCNADNCLRAVKNTASLAKVTADCSSFFVQTVTASASTITRTVTATSSPSSTGSVTQTNTLSYGTLTSTELATLTITPTVTISPTLSIETSVAKSIVLARRDVNPVPAYASLCSGAVRYSSACNCIGVTAGSTVTVPGPISYTTVTATSTLPVAVTILTKTSSTTIPASSTTQTKILTTSAPAVTSTVGLLASTTVTTISTSTAPDLAPTSTFCLKTTISGTKYVIGRRAAENTLLTLKPVGSNTLATAMFLIDDNTNLVTPDGLIAYVPGAGDNIQYSQGIRLYSPSTASANYNYLALVYCDETDRLLNCFAKPFASSGVYYHTTVNMQSLTADMSMVSESDPSIEMDVTYYLSTLC